MSKVYLVILTYDIEFKDSDEGWCVAGEGTEIISAHNTKESADFDVNKYNPILALAEKETTVFPVQKYNRQLKDKFGFVLDNITQNGSSFKLHCLEKDVYK